MEPHTWQTDRFTREFPAWRTSFSAIIGYESPAAAFPRLIPRRSRQHALGRAHNSALEMEEFGAARSGVRFESVYLESNGGLSSRVRGRGPRSRFECPQRMGWRRS